MTTDDRIARGKRATALLTSETFNDAMREISAGMKDAIVASRPEDSVKREQLYAEYHGLARVVKRLHSWADDGAIAAKDAGR